MDEQRIADAPAAPHAQDADYRPLYDRLQELKERKDSEWREKNNPFGASVAVVIRVCGSLPVAVAHVPLRHCLMIL